MCCRNILHHETCFCPPTYSWRQRLLWQMDGVLSRTLGLSFDEEDIVSTADVQLWSRPPSVCEEMTSDLTMFWGMAVSARIWRWRPPWGLDTSWGLVMGCELCWSSDLCGKYWWNVAGVDQRCCRGSIVSAWAALVDDLCNSFVFSPFSHPIAVDLLTIPTNRIQN